MRISCVYIFVILYFYVYIFVCVYYRQQALFNVLVAYSVYNPVS